MDFIVPYNITVLVMGLSGLLIWLQLAVVDVAAIMAKHTPGYAIAEDHRSFLFRAHRAFANTNESIGVFILFALFSILSLASPEWLNGFALLYLSGRVAHMLFYYFGQKLLRSTGFAISYIALLGMFGTGLFAWLNVSS
ncbi:hypothetical protein PA25_36560 [Pseudoalteromonas sp. A25]|uniref:MAPEG family protein n=1 Tax=Pseudoalteromonas sp. A25 TaxID=116092 RepID=UPI001260B2E5|nr:MAPEG family protein [Pseudoalteromonas sp. A25]BBN83671.1 hypothetical protein PA25_36560 [Pseudoalteromonas sp. A25]